MTRKVHYEGSATHTSCGRPAGSTVTTYKVALVTCYLCRSTESGVTVETLKARDAQATDAAIGGR